MDMESMWWMWLVGGVLLGMGVSYMMWGKAK